MGETWIPPLLLAGLMALAAWILGRGELMYQQGYDMGYHNGLEDGREGAETALAASEGQS